MTLGDKIRQARRGCGLSQEQLADKLAVSRSAVAKWETDKGLPDVGNLKILARLLGVSVDDLLDEAETADASLIREPYSLASCGQGCKKVKKDRLVCERFPDAKIFPLFARQDKTGQQACASDPPDCGKGTKVFEHQTDRAFYLVVKEEKRLLVTVTDTCLEIRSLEQDCDRFQLGNWHFIRSNFELTD